jgi:murein DD-endopeptidase MepM/ murein hydrolase activator NlpD
MATGAMFPAVAQAGVLSGFLFSISASLHAEHGVGGGYQQNVQTMSLPRAAMNLDPNPSKGGGDITVIAGSALLSEEGPAGTLADIKEGIPHSNQISLYVVREGDTLSGIAGMFNVSVNTIRWGNNIAPGAPLKVGQTLTILPVTGVKHAVAKGDTIASISKKYKGDVEEIVSFNGIAADTVLAVGTEIIIPDGEIAPAVRLGATASASASTSGPPTYAGYYMRPVVGGTRTQGIHGYNGIDIAAPIGTPLLASAAGQVIVSKTGGWNGGYGNYVVIKHDNGTQTLYAHNSQNIVSVGQWVVQGQVVAYMGSTGRSTGSHVHFEVRGARNPF